MGIMTSTDQKTPEVSAKQPFSLRRSLTRAAVAVGIVVLCTVLDVVSHSDSEKGSKALNREHVRIEKAKPRVIFVGNSLLDKGIDEKQFTEITGVSSMKYAKPGHGATMWYVIIKNVIAAAEHKPEMVAVVFRDYLLTDPMHNVTGRYKNRIAYWSEPKEPVVDQLSYIPNMNKFEYKVLSKWRFWAERFRIKDKLDSETKKTVSRALGYEDKYAARDAVERVFANENMIQELLTLRQEADLEGKQKVESHLFEDQVDNSFLPHMVQIAKDRDIRLAFIRIRGHRFVNPKFEDKYLEEYIAGLSKYLEANDAIFLDYTDDERIQKEHFADGDHLNADFGMPLFTKLVAERLGPHLANK